MAKTDVKKTAGAPADSEPKPRGDFQALWMHMQRHPGKWAAAVVFIAAVAAAAGAYRVFAANAEKDLVGRYAAALESEDPAARAEALAKIAAEKSRFSAEALYLQAESAYEARKFEDAKSAYQRLRETYPDFEFAPDAVEGIGYVEENAGRLDEARARYEEIMQSWPESFAAKRQPLNLARVLEKKGDFQAAVQSYRDQLNAFPGSNASRRAEEALARLRKSKPELFASETTGTAAGSTEDLSITLEPEAVPLDETITPGESAAPPVTVPDTAGAAPHTEEAPSEEAASPVAEPVESAEEEPAAEPPAQESESPAPDPR